MRQSRRRFLHLSGGALGSSIAFGGTTGTALAEKPAMRYESAYGGNYADASRTSSDLRWVVVHTIEGNAEAGIATFKDPSEGVSSHFVVGFDGTVTQMVDVEDIAYTNGNYGYNATGINIELAGYADETDFPEAQIEATADLTRWLCNTHDIPKRHPTDDLAPCSAYGGQGGLIGHEQIPDQDNCNVVTGGKYDPGYTWPWNRFVSLVQEGGGTTNEGQLLERGERLVTAGPTTVRSSPDVSSSNVTFTQPADVAGTAIGGPLYESGFVWYRIEYDNGYTGWSPRTKLELAGPFAVNDRVSPVVYTRVYDKPDRSSTVVGYAGTGTGGYVRDGPKIVDGGRFWRIEFNSGVMGWVTETNVQAAPLSTGSNPAFEIGQRVASTVDLNVRESPDGSDVGTADAGTTGYVKDGIVTAGGYTWWKIDWTGAPTGWSVQEYLEGATDAGGGSVRQPRPIDVDTPIDVRVDVTAAEIDDAIAAIEPASPLIGLGDTWVDVQNRRDVDALYQAAHACLESAYGTSAIAQRKNNLYGFDARDVCPAECADEFASFEQSIREVMEYVDQEYLTPGGDYYVAATLDGMNANYATDPRWAEKTADIYNRLVGNI